jgi:hypothetical protein
MGLVTRTLEVAMAGGRKLTNLMEQFGYDDLDDLLAAAVFDHECYGICRNDGCDYSIEVEPDQEEGWCEECQQYSVASCLVLAGMI